MKLITTLSAHSKYKGKFNTLVEQKCSKHTDKNKQSKKKNERTDRNI
jgi:hypothetical protein